MPAAPVPRQRARLILPDPEATAAFAGAIAGCARTRDVIGLRGALGSGKTVFARGFVNALARAAGLGSCDVPSPTFTLLQPYEIGDRTVYHFDLYRLETQDDALELGIEDAYAEGISLIEWPERLGPLIPARAMTITLCQGAGDTVREADVEADGGWFERIGGALDRFRA